MLLVAWTAACPAFAQQSEEPDRSDPAIIEQERAPREASQPRQPRLRMNAPAAGTSAATDDGSVFAGIRVTGASRLPFAAFAPAIEPFLARPLSQGDLVRLATAVATVARDAGFGLATAWVPAQDVHDGVLIVQVDEGRIDAVRASGPGSSIIEQRLAAIAGRGPVETEELERRLLLAGDLAGMWVGDAQLVREGGRNILSVQTRYQPVQGRISIDNWGGSLLGRVRASAEAELRGAVRRGDSLMIGLATTPTEPGNFQLLEGRYRTPLGLSGTIASVGGYFGRTDVEASARNPAYSGDSWQLDVEATHPLARSRTRSWWLTARAELRDSALDRSGQLIRDDRIFSGALSLYGYERLVGGRLRVRAAITQGLDAFGATEAGDPVASRSDAGGVFTKAELWSEFVRSFGDGFSTQVAIRGQLADGSLLATEEIGLGGPDFLRAFDYREKSGDQGIAGAAELRFDISDLSPVMNKVQIYGFADAGHVGNLGAGNGRTGTLASAGGGIRLTVARNWHLGTELAVPLHDDDHREDHKPRFSVSLRAYF